MNCKLPDCSRPTKGQGYCGAHYQRVLTHGDPRESVPIMDKQPGRQCAVEGCEGRHGARGYCYGHYQRLVNGGDVCADRPLRILQSGWLVDNRGYIKLWTGQRYELEHRIVMEVQLRRGLSRDETVHHKNGDRTDNRIENLELWTSRHGGGQTVTDRVRNAVAVLSEYAPHLLAEEAL